MPSVNASSLLPPQGNRGPVQPGMSELEAGEAITRYMDAVAERTEGDDGDIDMFDGGLTAREEPAEDSSSPKPDSEDSAPRGDVGESEDDGGDGESPADSSEEEEAQDGSTQEDADAQAPSLEASQLAAILGVEEDALVVTDDGALQLRYRVDGEAGEATLKDVLASYQLQGHVNKKSEQLSEERRQLREAVLKRESELQEAIEQAGAFQKVMEDRVYDRYSKVDWDKLRVEDPGRAALMHQEMLTEVQGIRAEAEQVRVKATEQVQQAQAARQQAQHEWLVEQQKALFQHLPDLADEVKRPEILRGYQEYLLGYGFRLEEIQNTHDHRFIRVIDDAVAYRRMLADQKANAPGGPPKKVVEKKLVRVPKVARGGVAGGSDTARGDRTKRAANALRKSGSDVDAARYAVESGLADAVLGED